MPTVRAAFGAVIRTATTDRSARDDVVAGMYRADACAGATLARQPTQPLATELCLYYIGNSVAGSAGGVFWAHGGWMAVAAFSIALLAVALASALSLVTRGRDVARRGSTRVGMSAG